MDKEKLFTRVLDDGVKAAKRRETAQNREASRRKRQQNRKERRDIRAEERMQPFRELDRRNKAVVNAVSEMVEDQGSAPYSHADGINSGRTVMVVLGKAPLTDKTTNHMAVCAVTELRDRPEDDGGYTMAAFRFAFVPSGLVREFTDHGHKDDSIESVDIIGSLRWGSSVNRNVVAGPVEYTFWDSESTSGRDGKIISLGNFAVKESALIRLKRARKVNQENIPSQVSSVEASLALVMEAAANPDLNPHLFISPSSVGEIAEHSTESS